MVDADGSVLTHLRRGVVEYCVLAMLRDGPGYGRDIAKQLSAGGILMSGEGTLYPLLTRLRKSGLVQTTWQESSSGPPRRYYELTAAGTNAVAAFASTWAPFRDAVDTSLGES